MKIVMVYKKSMEMISNDNFLKIDITTAVGQIHSDPKRNMKYFNTLFDYSILNRLFLIKNESFFIQLLSFKQF